MLRRATVSALVALAAFASAGAAQNPRQPNPNPPQPASGQGAPGGGQGPGHGGQQPEGPKPYGDVITAQATTDSGVFIAHRLGDKLFYEIPRAMLGKEFLLVADQRGTAHGVRYAGEEITDQVVRWEQLGNHVFLRIVLSDIRADSTRPIARAVDLSNLAPIVASFDVAAYSPGDSNVVIDVTKLFTGDVSEFNIRQDRVKVRRLDPARSAIQRVRSFPRNVEVSALQTFEVDSVPGQGESINSLTMLMNYSMVLLPDTPMMPRLCDDRIGYFNLSFEDYDQEIVPRDTRCYIARFRLEPSNPAAAVSDPITPIVFYVDPATPSKWVPWIIKGVEQWEPIFRAAGFSNAIRAEPAPTNDPNFDLDDARYNTIRWLPSTTENAYGPHISDPRSGEVINANVMVYHNVMDLVQSWYFTQAGATDPRADRLPMPDSLLGQMLMYVVAHEVGHSLGLRHNMIASASFPVDSLRSRSFTCRMRATSSSIMDYARYNYVAQPGDDACLMQGMGPYDYFVIDWGYRRIPGAATPDAERPVLDSLARQQDTNLYLRYIGDGDPTDPRTVTEELGDDAVKASTYGFANLRRIVPMLIPATTTDRLDDYQNLNDLYGEVLNQWSREASHVASVVGGVYHVERYPSQDSALYSPVPRAKQAEAVRWLNDNVFATPTYFLDTAILRRIEPTGSVERLRTRQSQILGIVLNDARLGRLAEEKAFATDAAPAYGIADLLGDLRHGLFAETAALHPVTDVYRRNLQRAFVEQMNRLINTPLEPQLPPGFPAQFAPAPRPADARADARAELVALDAQLRAADLKTRDADTKAHFADLRARIDVILHPDAQAAAPATPGRRGVDGVAAGEEWTEPAMRY